MGKTFELSFLSSVTLCCLVTILASCDVSSAQRANDIPYSEAEQVVSSDPQKVVLQLVSGGSQTGLVQSFTVYGDGLVDFQKRRKDQALEEFTGNIGASGVQELMSIAVSHGLAEWDADTIMAWTRQKNPRTLNIQDGGNVHVSLHLSEYRRGDVRMQNHSKSFTVKTPKDAAEVYPEIPQFRGVHLLWERLAAERKKRLDQDAP